MINRFNIYCFLFVNCGPNSQHHKSAIARAICIIKVLNLPLPFACEFGALAAVAVIVVVAKSAGSRPQVCNCCCCC